jgi:hypothetical protein
LLLAACSSPRAPAARPEAVDGEVWIRRDLATGLVRKSSTLDTYRLILDGERATLEVSSSAAADDGGPWRQTATRTFLGTVTVDGGARIVELREAGSELVWRWSCAPHTYDVAPADAVRAPSPDGPECGDAGRWSKPTRPREVLACGGLADDDPELLEGIFAFAPAPGIEHLVVDDDCVAGGGLRAIAADGTIAPVR